MANIFKTTLKKDVIADIANNGKREVRFPIIKFWASRFADKYNLDDKTFVFKTFETLELSSPSNKDSIGETFTFNYDKTFVDGDEFVVVFKDIDEVEKCTNDNVQYVEQEDIIIENVSEEDNTLDEISTLDDDIDSSDVNDMNDEINITNDDILALLTQWLDDENVLNNFYTNESVFATNAKQVIILPRGKVIGFKKTLPVNNDVEVRIEFDINEKIYFDSILDFDCFEDEILDTLNKIRKNNFVFVWKRYTGIFMDDNGIYFGIKYSTRKSIGFNRKYNVQ